MQIKYENIILRDMIETDIEDYVRWFTAEREWEKCMWYNLVSTGDFHERRKSMEQDDYEFTQLYLKSVGEQFA